MADDSSSYDFDDVNIRRIKNMYAEKMKDDPNNPMKICIKLVMDSATEKDPMKRNLLSYEFSQFLTQPGGVMRLFLATVDFDTSSQKVSTHNQRFIAITNMILGLPNICMPFDDYCCNIAKQIKTMLYSDNTAHSSLGAIIIKFMIGSRRGSKDNLAEKIFRPIIESIYEPTICYMTTTQSINSIHNLLTNNLPIRYFVPLFHDLVFALITLKKTPSNLKKVIKTILCQILNGLRPGPSCCLIQELIMRSKSKIRHKFEVIQNEDGIDLEVVTDMVDYDLLIDFDDIQDTLFSLLEFCDNQSLVLELFFHFREEMWKSSDKEFGKRCFVLVETLLDETIKEKADNKLNLFEIIPNNITRTLELITRTLAGYLDFFKSHRDEREGVVVKSIKGCLDILEIVSLGLTKYDDDFEYLRSGCLSVLKQSKDSIMSTEDDLGENRETKKAVVNQLSSIIRDITTKDGRTDEPKKDSKLLSERKYRECIKDLNDKLVPVRVHGLVELKRSIMTNDPYTISRIPEIQSMIEGSLADPETYVFLECINLMAEMTLRKTKEILPKLIELYASQNIDLQHRINVGEILVRLTKQLNDTTPHYCDQIMNTLLNGLRDLEELIRMSSLVNVGEICRNLGDSLGKYMVEILTYLEYIIDNQDESLQVKCAAIDLLRTTLSGLNSLKVESIQQDLSRIYKILKKLRQYQTKVLDVKLDTQVDLFDQELSRIARELLGLDVEKSQSDLVKKINVLQLN